MAANRKIRVDSTPNQRLIDRTVKAYVALRDEKGRIKKAAEDKIAEIDQKLDKLAEVLKHHMDEAGLESVRAPSGTAFKTYKEYVNVESWDSLLDWVIKEQAYHFFVRNVSKAAVKDFMEENGTLPPGVRYERELEIQVRRPT